MSSDALPLLSIRGVGKTYAQPVLAEIDLQLFGGEVLALTGENGAGKSTLSKIVGGLERPGAGSLELLGRPYAPASRREAEALGVRMVMQELNLLPTLSVAENLFLHDLPRRAGWIDRRRLRAAARRRWPRSAWRRSIPTRWSATSASATSRWSRLHAT